MSVNSTLARIPHMARSTVESVVAHIHHIAATVFGSGNDEQLPFNVERHGRHLLVRVTASHNQPGSRSLSSGTQR